MRWRWINVDIGIDRVLDSHYLVVHTALVVRLAVNKSIENHGSTTSTAEIATQFEQQQFVYTRQIDNK